jgi:hypothetical protein
MSCITRQRPRDALGPQRVYCSGLRIRHLQGFQHAQPPAPPSPTLRTIDEELAREIPECFWK